jgi:hypothetical protein
MKSTRRRAFVIVSLIVAGGLCVRWFAPGRTSEIRAGSEGAGSHDRMPRASILSRTKAEALQLFGRISGHVHSRSGNALSNARVCRFCAQCDTRLSGNEPICAQPDPSGLYALTNVPPGDYRIVANADGHLPRLVNQSAPLHLTGADISDQDAELEVGGVQVSGIVSDATGGPVAGAIVQANFTSDALPPGRLLAQLAISDEQGAFVLSAGEGPLFLLARADGYAAANLPVYAPAQGVRLVLTPASQISGSVRALAAADKTPLVGIDVVARSGFQQQRATTDSDGKFVMTGLRPGVYSLDASGDGWIGRNPGSVTVDISDKLENVVIHVIRAVRVSGTLSVGDRPCVTGMVALTAALGESLPTLSAVADLSGHLEFNAVPAGKYDTQARCDDYGTESGPVLVVGAVDVTDLRWTIEQGVDVTVHAVGRDGRPVAHATIDLRPAPQLSASAAVSTSPASPTSPAIDPKFAETNAEGSVRFKGVRAGAHVIGGPDVETPLTVQVSQNRAADFNVVLRPVGEIEVTVRDKHGRPNDAVAVSAAPQDPSIGPVAGIAEPRGAGRYHIGPIPAGKYRVEVRDGANPIATADGPDDFVDVRSGELQIVQVNYGGDSGRITGRVLDSAGTPLENVWAEAVPASANTDFYSQALAPRLQLLKRQSLTDAEGRFAIEGLVQSASFAIVASHSLGGQARLDGVSPGQNVEITLSAPGRLSGVVLDERGQPPAFFQIVISNPHGGQQLNPEFGPDAKGKWTVDHVAPGAIEILAQAPEGFAIATRQLAPAQRLDDLSLQLQSQPTAPN